MSESATAYVPVLMNGERVGSAKVSQDGQLEISISTHTDLAKILFVHMRAGFADSLSIMPNLVPVTDARNTSFVERATMEIPRVRSWNEFRKSGLLWLINRVLFHPRGRAINLVFNEGGESLGWSLHGDGKKPWSFPVEEDQMWLPIAEQTLREVE